MTQRQLAEKYDGPGYSNISPFYEWLPLLLLTQIHGQLLQRIIINQVYARCGTLCLHLLTPRFCVFKGRRF